MKEYLNYLVNKRDNCRKNALCRVTIYQFKGIKTHSLMKSNRLRRSSCNERRTLLAK